MTVVVADAPLDTRDLTRLAARAVFARRRCGLSTHPSLRVTNASGPQTQVVLPTDSISALFEATLDATEEAIDNSLLKATRYDGERPHHPGAARGTPEGTAREAAPLTQRSP